VGPRDHLTEALVTEFAAAEADEGVAEAEVRLDEVLADVGDRPYYEYDSGDGWQHTLDLAAVSEYAEGAPRASVLDGERA